MAFIFAGKSNAEEDEAIRRTAGGRGRRAVPVPAFLYEQIRANTARPPLVLTVLKPSSANDPSMLAVARAAADTFFEACPD